MQSGLAWCEITMCIHVSCTCSHLCHHARQLVCIAWHFNCVGALETRQQKFFKNYTAACVHARWGCHAMHLAELMHKTCTCTRSRPGTLAAKIHLSSNLSLQARSPALTRALAAAARSKLLPEVHEAISAAIAAAEPRGSCPAGGGSASRRSAGCARTRAGPPRPPPARAAPAARPPPPRDRPPS